jgi:hypothetical protein
MSNVTGHRSMIRFDAMGLFRALKVSCSYRLATNHALPLLQSLPLASGIA